MIESAATSQIMLGFIKGILFAGLMFLPLFFLILRGIKKKESPYPVQADSFETYEYLRKNIESCSKYCELVSCSHWVDKNEFNLNPKALKELRQRIKEKESSLQENLARITGEAVVGKFQ